MKEWSKPRCGGPTWNYLSYLTGTLDKEEIINQIMDKDLDLIFLAIVERGATQLFIQELFGPWHHSK